LLENTLTLTINSRWSELTTQKYVIVPLKSHCSELTTQKYLNCSPLHLLEWQTIRGSLATVLRSGSSGRAHTPCGIGRSTHTDSAARQVGMPTVCSLQSKVGLVQLIKVRTRRINCQVEHLQMW